MSGLSDKLSACDRSGAKLKIQVNGRDSHGNCCGGLCSLTAYFLTLSFLAMQLHRVLNYDDPTISSYVVMEDRA